MSIEQDEKCLVCESALNHEGECPDGHTEEINYGVIEGVEWGEKELFKESLRTGVCQVCDRNMQDGQCPSGCFKDI